MSSPTIPLTGAQKNALQAIADDPHLSPDFAKMGEVNPNLRVFVVNFDGTWNDKDDVPPGESSTIVAKLYEDSAAFNSPTFESHYVSGVGTRTSKMKSLWEGATGAGCKDRAEAMHDLLKATADRWRQENPNVEIHVHTTGFSRGAASSLHFLNLVDEFGACSRTADAYQRQAIDACSIGPGKVKSSAMLFDVVATGQEKVLKLTVPPTTQSVLHLTAGGEERRHFKLVSLGDDRYDKMGKRIEGANNAEWSQAKNVGMPPVRGPMRYPCNEDGSFFYQRIRQIDLPGARHSDVGGAYDKSDGIYDKNDSAYKIKGGIAGLPLYLARAFQSTLGIPGKRPVRPSFWDIQHGNAHDSRDAIESTRQLFQELGGKTFSRDTVKREQAKKQPRHWGGDTLRSVTLTLRDHAGKVFATKTTQSVVPHPNDRPLPSDQNMGMPNWLSMDPMRVQKTTSRMLGSGRVSGQSSREFVVDEDARTIHYQGIRIDDVGSMDSLVAPIMDKTQNHWLEVSVTREKIYCQAQNGNQIAKPGKKKAAQFDFGDDPWCFQILEAIQILNERTHANPSDPRQFTPIDQTMANSLIGRALQGSAAHALKAEGADAVTFKVVKSRGSSDLLRVTGTFEFEGKTETYPFKGIAQTQEDLNRRTRIGWLVSGIEEVANMLNDAGHNFTGQSMKIDKEKSQAEIVPLYQDAMLGGEEPAQKPRRMQPGR